MNIYYNQSVKERIWKYFEDYQDDYSHGYLQTDMNQRSRIYRILQNITNYLGQTYTNNERNYIKVDNIVTVEYEIANDKKTIAIKNIYFNNKQNKTYNNQKEIPQYENFGSPQYGYQLVRSKYGYNYTHENDKGKLIYRKKYNTHEEDNWFTNVDVGGIQKNGNEFSVIVILNGKTYRLFLSDGELIDEMKYITNNNTLNEEIQKSLDFMWRLLKVS